MLTDDFSTSGLAEDWFESEYVFNPLLAARFVWHRLAAAKITLAQAAAAATVSSQQHHLQAALFPPKHTVSRRFVNKFMSHKDAFSEDHEILCQHQEVLGQC